MLSAELNGGPLPSTPSSHSQRMEHDDDEDAEIRHVACYSLSSFRRAAADSVPFLWTRGWYGNVEVYSLAVGAYSYHFSPNFREFRIPASIGVCA